MSGVLGDQIVYVKDNSKLVTSVRGRSAKTGINSVLNRDLLIKNGFVNCKKKPKLNSYAT